MKHIINPSFRFAEKQIVNYINNFDIEGTLFGDAKRNIIKLFEFENKTINVKSFKIPHFINKITYKYFRKSKARRSFEYATILIENGIGTPMPIAYFEDYDSLGLNKSFYVCEHLHCDLTYRELVEIPDFPEHSTILRQFAKFTFDLHEKGIEFLDHSPGNTLIKKIDDGKYNFYLVDLNRMNFHKILDFDMRMKNFGRLTPKKEMVAIMSNEYAKLYTLHNESEIFEKMWFYTSQFQREFSQRQRLKKKLKFLKSKF